MPEIVHHKDEDRLNDSPENLQPMSDSGHKSLHGSGKNHYMWMDINKEKILITLDKNQWRVNRTIKALNISAPALRRRLLIYGINIKSGRDRFLGFPSDIEIRQALKTSNGVISKAARLLNVTRPKLEYRLNNRDIELHNHVITKIENITRKTSVYDLEVDGAHNFIANEICVHNSSSQVNLQNQPRLLGPRECFIPRKGRRHFHIDYEQVEMRFFVHFSGDKTMAAAINDDIHLTVAAEVYDKPKEEITKEQRKRGKGVSFGIIYGAGPATISETLTKKGLPTSVAEGTQVTGKYHRRFPSVRRTIKELGTQLKKYGYITNPFGRRYHIPVKFSYISLNYMCQGTSADLMKRAMVRLWEWLRTTNKISRIILTVHDEIVLECPQIEELEVVTKAIEIMEELEMFDIPITVSVDVVKKRWSQKIKPSALGFDFN